MIIQGSIFGAISDPNQWEFSCILPDGRLDKEKFREYVRMFMNMGANASGELPYLVTDKHYKGIQKQFNFLPFLFINGEFDLSKFNEIYFQNLSDMADIVNSFNNAIFVFSIFDRCHGLQPDSPWIRNIQKLENAWYDFNKYAKAYVEKVLDTLAGKNIIFVLENEPQNEGFLVSGVKTLQAIKARGYHNSQIEWGVFHIGDKVEYNKNGELITTPLRVRFKNKLAKLGLYTEQNKSEYWKTIHDFGNNQDKLDEIQNMIKFNRAHHYLFSNDGQKPKADDIWWEKTMKPIFIGMVKKGGVFNWRFDILYRGLTNGVSKLGDSLLGVKGLSDVYKEIYGKYPENYGKHPMIVDPIKTEEEMKKIKELEIKIEGLEKENVFYKKENRLLNKLLIDSRASDDWKFFTGFYKKIPFPKLAIGKLFIKEWKGVLLGGLSLWLLTLIIKLFKLIF